MEAAIRSGIVDMATRDAAASFNVAYLSGKCAKRKDKLCRRSVRKIRPFLFPSLAFST